MDGSQYESHGTKKKPRNYTKLQGRGAWGKVVGICEKCERNVSKNYRRRGLHNARQKDSRPCNGLVRVDLVLDEFRHAQVK